MRSAFNGIHRIVSYICFSCAVLLFFMMLLTIFDITGRGVFNKPIPGAYEITEYLLVVFVLGGMAYTQQVDQHIRVDFLVTRLSKRTRKILEIIITSIGFFFMCFVIWQGILGGIYAFGEGTFSDTLSIPDYVFQFFIPFGAFLFALEYMVKVVDMLTNQPERQIARERLD